MAEYRRGAHAVFDLKYHVAWITKYWDKVLRGDVAERAHWPLYGASPDKIRVTRVKIFLEWRRWQWETGL